MTPQKYQALKKAIQEANPSILELKFGCEVMYGRGYMQVLYSIGEDIYCTYQQKGDGRPVLHMLTRLQREYDKTFEILGRPIRLSDVLLAIRKGNGIANCRGAEGDILYIKPSVGEEFAWFLKGGLDAQSDQCKEFISKVLGV